MDTNNAPSLTDAFAANRDWWRDAGVDWCFDDTPHEWLASAQEQTADVREQTLPRAATVAAATVPALPPIQQRITPDRGAWPQQLEQFAAWWLNEPSLDESGAHPRVAPQGMAQPDLMVIVPAPEVDDRDSLMSGPQGRFLANMLAAMGLNMGKVYIAAALPRHTPHADWAGLEQAGMGAVLRHHIMLVSPRHVLIFGSGVLSLLGHDPAQNPASFTQIAVEGSAGPDNLPALATWDIPSLLTRARARANLWQRWLEWTDGW